MGESAQTFGNESLAMMKMMLLRLGNDRSQ